MKHEVEPQFVLPIAGGGPVHHQRGSNAEDGVGGQMGVARSEDVGDQRFMAGRLNAEVQVRRAHR